MPLTRPSSNSSSTNGTTTFKADSAVSGNLGVVGKSTFENSASFKNDLEILGALTVNGNLVQNINTTAKTANYQLLASDANTMVQMNGAFVFQVDSSLSSLPKGTTFNLVAQTLGVSVAATTNATAPVINATPGLKLRAAWSVASLIKMTDSLPAGSASTWLLTGDLSL